MVVMHTVGENEYLGSSNGMWKYIIINYWFEFFGA